MKNSDDTIGNRIRDLPACSAVLSSLEMCKIQWIISAGAKNRQLRGKVPWPSVATLGFKYLVP